ncbi:MAG: T9SS type A sorting domain-containing protein [Bacteroidetes bacterium]|nr:T9SS type A sorting domain-containing protein [Bacteroidota bacterium]
MKFRNNSFIFFLCVVTLSSAQQNTWTKKADFTGTERTSAVGFAIDTNGYIGTGYDTADFKRNFYSWNQNNNLWRKISGIGGASGSGLSRDMAVCFVVNSKAYVGTGQGLAWYMNDFWMYDPVANAWTQVADFMGSARRGAVGFSIGSKGYAGLGLDQNGLRNDFFEYDPAANLWTAKANFPNTPRQLAVGFSIGAKGYVGTGDDGILKNDFWEFDPAANTWIPKANFSGTPRRSACAFVIDSIAFVGTGYDNTLNYKNDFWKYSPATDSWTQIANFGGTPRANAVAFSVGSFGYVGTGYDGFMRGDFWEYSPVLAVEELEPQISVSVFPNPFAESATLRITNGNRIANYEFKLYDINGKKISPEIIRTSDSFVIRRGGIAAGIYFYEITFRNKILHSGKLITR